MGAPLSDPNHWSHPPDDPEWAWTVDEPLLSYRNSEFTSVIVAEQPRPGDTGLFLLAWSDYVANAWFERYDSLAAAVLRLGALVDAVERGRTFTGGSEDFARRAAEFLRGASE